MILNWEYDKLPSEKSKACQASANGIDQIFLKTGCLAKKKEQP